jgi:hypothetical protein
VNRIQTLHSEGQGGNEFPEFVDIDCAHESKPPIIEVLAEAGLHPHEYTITDPMANLSLLTADVLEVMGESLPGKGHCDHRWIPSSEYEATVMGEYIEHRLNHLIENQGWCARITMHMNGIADVFFTEPETWPFKLADIQIARGIAWLDTRRENIFWELEPFGVLPAQSGDGNTMPTL